MDPTTAYFIVASRRGRRSSSTRQVSPCFDSLQKAVHALNFMRERLPRSETLHIEQGAAQRDCDA